MYALKLITVTLEGHHAEENQILGNWYRLIMRSKFPDDESASIKYIDDKGNPQVIIIGSSDEACITLLDGEIHRVIHKGDPKKREKLSDERWAHLMARAEMRAKEEKLANVG